MQPRIRIPRKISSNQALARSLLADPSVVLPGCVAASQLPVATCNTMFNSYQDCVINREMDVVIPSRQELNALKVATMF